MKLTCFQEEDDSQEDLVEVEKKEDLNKKQMQKTWRQLTGLSIAPSKLSTGPIDCKTQKREENSVCR